VQFWDSILSSDEILATEYESSRTLNARLQPDLPKKSHQADRS
jgi:hypothetical protein